MARRAARRPRGVGAGADRGRPARGSADGRRGAAGRGRACAPGAHARCWRRPSRWCGEAPFRERRWALLALAQYQAGRQARGARTLRRRADDARRRARPRPRARAGRARAGHAAAGPVAAVAAAPAQPSARCAPTAGCCPTTPRTPTRSSAARTTSPPACAGCATPACSPWSGRPASASPRWSGPGVVAVAATRRPPVVVITPGRAPDGRLDCLAGDAAGRRPCVVDQAEEAVTALRGPRRATAVLRRARCTRRAGATGSCSRCGPTTWATWPRTRTSPGSLEEGLYLLGADGRGRPARGDRGARPAGRAAARARAGRPAGPRGRGRARPRCRCCPTCCARPGSAGRAAP